MVKVGCTLDGNLNDANFNEPMPWIGLYIAAASLVCAIAMGADIILGFRHRKFWFPCKWFSFNATSLTLIAVASKLSVDLNTSMPRCKEQLAKLSSGVFTCVVMGNLMPSLGSMDKKEAMTNIIALGILVITIAVNIGIQLGTGVIYSFWIEHGFIMFLMLVMLLILTFSAMTVPTTKQYLEAKYKKKHRIAKKEFSPNGTERQGLEKIKDDLLKYWMMAYTSSPQFVIGRSVTCTASGALCLLSALTLAEAMLRSYFMSWSFKFCSGESDYKWSAILVLIAQTIAVGVGTFAPAARWFTAIQFRCPMKGKCHNRKEFNVENYWIKSLIEMKQNPIRTRVSERHLRKLAHNTRNLFLEMCIFMQCGIVLASKVIRLISVYCVAGLLKCYDLCKKLKKLRISVSNIDVVPELYPGTKVDLSRFVLHLEGEEELVDFMMKKNCYATNHWMRGAKREEPKNLIKLLEKSTVSGGFQGIKEFDSDNVPFLHSEEPPNCWALPVVTLMGIAVALPNINPKSIKKLFCGVSEGLRYVKLVEKYLDTGGNLMNIIKTADVVWLGVDLYHRWFDVDLQELSLQGKCPKEILETLSDIAYNSCLELKRINMDGCLYDIPSKWPIKLLAANSMYRISQTILLNYDHRNNQTSERLFEAILAMISDILGACLMNLHRVIYVKCLRSDIEHREDCVRRVALHVGRTEKIMDILYQRALPSLDPDEMACIDKWRDFYNLSNPQPLSSEKGKATSSDLFLTIEQRNNLEV